ncbi:MULTISPECIES: FAD-binding protein [unclassified Streptomyces]|uniref:FAD-binding protein n=1 Tax=unclassified Streptomyces TaxID=2593676 RepID=UPI0037F9D692
MTENNTSLSGYAGLLRTDHDALLDASRDFGHIVSGRPLGVLRPRSVAEIRELLSFASARGLPVAVRGGAHSLFGQGQAPGGLVIDMAEMNEVLTVTGTHAAVQAGALWRDVMDAVIPHGLTPPVLTDYLGASVGGVLCTGGIGGASHRSGLVADSVQELEVVTATGEHVTCSPERDPALFHAVLAGLGQYGIIVRATLRLVPAPGTVRRYCLYYTDLSAYLTDQRRLAHERRFLYVEGQARPAPGQRWQYMIEAVAAHTGQRPPDDARLIGDLAHDPDIQEVTDLGYAEFADRVAHEERLLTATGEWGRPHPWLNLLLPERTAAAVVTEVLADSGFKDLRTTGLVLLYPLLSERLRAPMLRRPDGELLYLFSLLRTAPPGGTEAVEPMVAANRAAYEYAKSMGAFAYPINALPMAPADWRAHYGDQWRTLAAAKRRYDPHAILTRGHGLRW